MAIPIMTIFVKIFKNHIQAEFVKNREFTPVIIFFLFFTKNDNLGPKMKVLKFLGMHTNYWKPLKSSGLALSGRPLKLSGTEIWWQHLKKK